MAEFNGNNNQKMWETMGWDYAAGTPIVEKNREVKTNAMCRANGIPVDLSSVHATYADAVVYAATKSIAYADQIIAAEGVAYIITPESQGTLEVSSYRDSLTGAITNFETPQVFDIFIKPIGVIPTGDGKSISVTEDGEIAIVGADGATAEQVLRIKEDGTGVEWVDASDIVDISVFAENAIVRKDDGIYANIIAGEGPAPEGVAKRYYINVNNSKSGVNIDIPYDARLEGIGHDTTVAAYVANAVASAGHLKREIVSALPEEDIDLDTIYMVLAPEEDAGEKDVYIEYMYINGVWEKIGDTQTSLDGYVTESDLDSLIASYYTKMEVIEHGELIKTQIEEVYATKGELSALESSIGEEIADLGDTFGDYYTKAEADAIHSAHETAADAKYATKAALTAHAETAEATYRKISDSYSASKIDEMLAEITGSSAGTSAQVQANLEAYQRANDVEIWGASVVNGIQPTEGGYLSPSYYANEHKSRIDLLEESKISEVKVGTDLDILLKADIDKATTTVTIDNNGLVAALAAKAETTVVDGINTRVGANETAIAALQTYNATHEGQYNTLAGIVGEHTAAIALLIEKDTEIGNELVTIGKEVEAQDEAITDLEKEIDDLAKLHATDKEELAGLIAAETSRATAAEKAISDSLAAVYYTSENGTEGGILITKFNAVDTKATNNALAIQDLRDTVGNLTNVMNFRGAVTPSVGFTDPNLDTDALATLGEVENGDVILYGELEYVYDATKAETHRWVEFGNASANAAAIASLQEIVTGHGTTLGDHGRRIADLEQGLGNVVDVELPKIPGLISDAVAEHAAVMAHYDGNTYYAGHVMSTEKATFVDGELTKVSTDLLVQGAFELVLNGGNASGAAN